MTPPDTMVIGPHSSIKFSMGALYTVAVAFATIVLFAGITYADMRASVKETKEAVEKTAQDHDKVITLETKLEHMQKQLDRIEKAVTK